MTTPQDGAPQDQAIRFRMVDLAASGRASDTSIEEQLSRLADEGWEPIAFDRLSINGPITFLLRRAEPR